MQQAGLYKQGTFTKGKPIKTLLCRNRKGSAYILNRFFSYVPIRLYVNQYTHWFSVKRQMLYLYVGYSAPLIQPKNMRTKTAADDLKYRHLVNKNAHLFLSYSHFVSPMHQYQISLLLGKLFHLFGCFTCNPLPLRHLISV